MDHKDFPILTQNSRYVAFRNKRFDMQTLTAQNWNEIEIENYTHFFDADFDELKPTPKWDKLVTHQFDAERVRMLEVMIGKSFFPLKTYDNWQVFLFLLGDGNVGKSTIINIIRAMFGNSSTIGTISATQEKTFGFQTLHNKRCVFVPDMTKNFPQLVEQAQFQSMISGDSVSVAKKGLDAINLEWKAPIVMAGNFLAGYTDERGSISRRTFSLEMTHHIKGSERDTNLETDIIAQKLVQIFIRCVRQYRRHCEEFSRQDFWKFVAGPAFDDMQNSTASATNTLDHFLDEGDDQFMIHKKEDVYTTMSDFMYAYNLHLSLQRLPTVKSVSHSKLLDRKYEIKQVHVCVTCKLLAVKGQCKCASPVRRKKTIIKHLQIIHVSNGM